MLARVISFVLSGFCVLAFDELFSVNGELPDVTDMLEQGKHQYQLLQERGRLPKYGNCWKQAVLHIDESCRALTEETQSDIALHITNCFLEMSGHETYKCGNDKKPNLRAICINTMTDRAFNVYTEFYTHTQNMCWFLRGQLWQETIAENTEKVGRQLDRSAKNQEVLLRNQHESLEIQDKIMKYGMDLEQLLGTFVTTTQQHHDVIQVLTTTVANLQSWLIGEISWFDSVLFYLLTSFIIIFITSAPRTIAARLPMLLLLSINILFERLLCHKMSGVDSVDAKIIHGNYYAYVWYMRYAFIAISVAILVLSVYQYKDYLVENNLMLENLKQEVRDLSKTLKSNTNSSNSIITHEFPRDDNRFFNEFERNSSRNSISDLGCHTPQPDTSTQAPRIHQKRTPLIDATNSRYFLRSNSRQCTPDSFLI